MTGRREQNRRETRARILDAAKRLFPERGINGTTAVELAAAARVSRATFFNYFGTKDEVLTALWEEQVGDLEAVITELLERPASTEERVLLLFADLAEAVEEQPRYLATMAFELERSSRQETVAARSVLFRDQLRRLVDAGLRQGDVRTDYSPELLTEMIGTVYLSLLRNVWLGLVPERRSGGVPEAGRFIAAAIRRS